MNLHFSAYYVVKKPAEMPMTELAKKDKQLKSWFKQNKLGDIAYISIPEESQYRLHIVTSDLPELQSKTALTSIYQALLTKIKEMGLLVTVIPISPLTSIKRAQNFAKAIREEIQRQKNKSSIQQSN